MIMYMRKGGLIIRTRKKIICVRKKIKNKDRSVTCGPHPMKTTKAFNAFYRLFFTNRANRAVSSTTSARNADVGVNVVLSVSLRDSVYGAVSRAASARQACIVNFECHQFLPPF